MRAWAGAKRKARQRMLRAVAPSLGAIPNIVELAITGFRNGQWAIMCVTDVDGLGRTTLPHGHMRGDSLNVLVYAAPPNGR